MRLNACELEIDLFCRGLRVPDDVDLTGARGVSRTRAGLGSGLEVVLRVDGPQARVKPEVWLNAPVVEAFAQSSPYVLTGAPGPDYSYAIVDKRNGARYAARLPPEPGWSSQLTPGGMPMRQIGVMQGTYLGIYINQVCAFWNYQPSMNCRFCTTGQNVGVAEAADKPIDDVVATCLAARAEGATFVHLNGGFLGSRGLAYALPYVRAIKSRVGMLVGLQLAPERVFDRYDALIDEGVDHLSFCVELVDPEWFARVCPGKARLHGQELFFEAMEYCANRMPRGAVSGELIAGIEPIARTKEGIDRITSMGAFPTVCVFRPTVGSDMEDWPAPAFDDMREVMRYMYDACRRAWLPIGAAPGIEVSLVVNPDDAAMLVEPSAAVRAYELFRRVVRVAAKPIFARRMRPTAA